MHLGKAIHLEFKRLTNLKVTQEPLGKDRSIFAGTPEQIKEDTAAARRLGARSAF